MPLRCIVGNLSDIESGVSIRRPPNLTSFHVCEAVQGVSAWSTGIVSQAAALKAKVIAAQLDVHPKCAAVSCNNLLGVLGDRGHVRPCLSPRFDAGADTCLNSAGPSLMTSGNKISPSPLSRDSALRVGGHALGEAYRPPYCPRSM
jgi:hypothetical protein